MTKKELLKSLQLKAQEAWNHVRDASKPAADEGRAMNAEELTAFDKYEADAKTIEDSIKRLRIEIDLEKRQAAEEGEPLENPLPKKGPQDKAERDEIYRKAFWYALAKRQDRLSDVERQIFSEVNKAHSTTTTAGGYTIPVGFSNQLEIAMKWYGPMLEAGFVFDPGTGGNEFRWPTLNDTANTGAMISEGGDSADSVTDLTFAEKIFKAYKATSKLFAWSAEIEQDSAFSFENILAEALGERLGRIMNNKLTLGAGTTEPHGVVTASTQGTIGAGNLATELTRSNLIDLIHSVDKSYRSGAKVGFMFHDSTLAAFKKLALGSNDARPLWVPSMRDGEPATLEGYRYWVNNDVAEGASSAKSVLFGNFDKFKIRRAGGVRMLTSNDIYIATDSSAIVAFARFDSLLVDGGGGAIKHLRNLSS